jgi:hypothetical protein
MHSVPHSVRTVLRYITATNDKVGSVKCSRKNLRLHKRAVTESTEQILWLRELSLGVKQIATRFRSRWLDPAVSCSWCFIISQWAFISTMLQTEVFRINVHKKLY